MPSETSTASPPPALHAGRTPTCELAVGVLADVGGEPRPGEVEGIHDEEGPGAGHAARGHVDREELPEVRLGVVAREHVLDRVLEREVEGLRREVPGGAAALSPSPR